MYQTVKSTNGKIYEVKVLGEGIDIEYREHGTKEWQEANWSIFCENHGVELDALA